MAVLNVGLCILIMEFPTQMKETCQVVISVYGAVFNAVYLIKPHDALKHNFASLKNYLIYLITKLHILPPWYIHNMSTRHVHRLELCKFFLNKDEIQFRTWMSQIRNTGIPDKWGSAHLLRCHHNTKFKRLPQYVHIWTYQKWNESCFRPLLCTYRLKWAWRTSWGW